jgi:hypothetical protein
VTLVHTGWEKLGERGPAVRSQYLQGWETVFGVCFVKFADAESKTENAASRGSQE